MPNRVQERQRGVRERRLRKRVDRSREAAVGEITVALGECRYVRRARDGTPLPQAFEVAKDERRVLFQRAPYRASELIAAQVGLALVGWREEVASVERVVAEELIHRAVPLVAAAFQLDRDLRASRTPQSGFAV